MRVLFDACVPRPLRKHLAEFDVLLTVDRGMRYQQPTHTFDIGLVVVRVPGNHVQHFEPLLDEIRLAIRESAPGRVLSVGSVGG